MTPVINQSAMTIVVVRITVMDAPRATYGLKIIPSYLNFGSTSDWGYSSGQASYPMSVRCVRNQ